MESRSAYRRGLLFITIFIFLALLNACDMTPSYDFPDWEHGASGYSNALSWAEEEGLPLIVYFHTDWCGWCKKLDAEYLATDRMKAFLEGIPKVEINPDRGRSEKALAEKTYDVTGYPYFAVYIPSNGSNPLRVHPFKKNGHLSIDQFIQAIEDAIDSGYEDKR